MYKLSRQYKTTVTELILGNPGVNPYNLQIGMKLTICPGEGYEMPGMGNPDGGNGGTPGSMGGNNTGTSGNMGGGAGTGVETPGSMGGSGAGNSTGSLGTMGGNDMGTPDSMGGGVMELQQKMRLAWLSHVYWLRMYLMSVLNDAPDQQEVEERLLETADEITNVFAGFLPVNVTRQLRNLLTEHIEIGGEIIHALKAGNTENYDGLIKEWYANANQIADLLGSQNPYFDNRETRNMLLKHLDLEREDIEQQVNGEYGKSIDTFRDIIDHTLRMADYFARGLLAR